MIRAALFEKTFSPPRLALCAILILAAFLRFWHLGSAEMFHDEGSYAFRSIGYLDYLNNDDQTQPVQWFKDRSLPWWTRLSFHDHPPLFFFTQYVFFSLFGDSRFVARLPSALFGLASVLFIYLLARRVFRNQWAGVLAALLLSVHHMHVWVSRSSIIESMLLFFVILNLYFFIRFLEDPRFWMAWGFTFGLVMLTKYTGFFLAPAYGAYLLLCRRDIYRHLRFYGAVFLAILVFSPVILYNIFLWRSVGHFDLQFAYLFGQAAPEWRASLGKIQDPFGNIGANLLAAYSIPFLLLTAGGLIASFFFWKRTRENIVVLGWFAVFVTTVLLVPMGSAFRFIALYIPSALMFALFSVASIRKLFPASALFTTLLIAFLAYELFFTVQGIFFEFPDFGVAGLDRYFDKEFRGFRSASFPQSKNPHLNAVITRFLPRSPSRGDAFMIIYDENIALAAKLWLFERRLFYHGILAVTTGRFKSFLKDPGPDYFKGYTMYFVKATPNYPDNPYYSTSDAGDFESFLRGELRLLPAAVIRGEHSIPMFFVYTFSL